MVQEAIEAEKFAVSSQPSNVHAWLRLSDMLTQQQQQEEALQILEDLAQQQKTTEMSEREISLEALSEKLQRVRQQFATQS
jgi:predicted Zn-dependent protease